MMTSKVSIERLSTVMGNFGLKHAPKQLADIIDAAEMAELSYKEFLMQLLDSEVKGRNERKRKRNYAAAHFPPQVRALAEFDCSELESGITSGQINQLKELNWLDSCGNVVFAGPPGLGKTMLALGIGLHAIDEGYTVVYEKMDKFIDILDRADIERASGFRLRYIKKAQQAIIDEVGYTPLNRTQANRFFNFISDSYEKSSLIITTNVDIHLWAEVIGDPVLTTAMLDRILHHARCFSLRGESYRLKYPEAFITKG
jgi:DNA replication protein DnaC